MDKGRQYFDQLNWISIGRQLVKIGDVQVEREEGIGQI